MEDYSNAYQHIVFACKAFQYILAIETRDFTGQRLVMIYIMIYLWESKVISNSRYWYDYSVMKYQLNSKYLPFHR